MTTSWTRFERQFVRTGRTSHEIRETAPRECPNGHPLRGNVTVGFNDHPSGTGRARVYRCRTCAGEVWADPAV